MDWESKCAFGVTFCERRQLRLIQFVIPKKKKTKRHSIHAVSARRHHSTHKWIDVARRANERRILGFSRSISIIRHNAKSANKRQRSTHMLMAILRTFRPDHSAVPSNAHNVQLNSQFECNPAFVPSDWVSTQRLFAATKTNRRERGSSTRNASASPCAMFRFN